MKSKYIDRKEIADIIERTVMCVCRKEKALGLLACKVKDSKPVQYRRDEVELALKERGYIV